jgi:hypothetical protein
MEFNLKNRELSLMGDFGSNDIEIIKFNDIISRSTYRRSDEYYIEVIIKNFENPIRIVCYKEYEHGRDEDAARLDLIFGGHF